MKKPWMIRVFAGVVVVLVLFVAFVAINLIDEPLNPEVTALLNEPQPATVQAVAGYKYSLGMGAALAEKSGEPVASPAELGEKIYQSLKQIDSTTTKVPRIPSWHIDLRDGKGGVTRLPEVYQSKTKLKPQQQALQLLVKNNRTYIARYNQLIAFGAMGSDLETSMFHSRPVMPLLETTKLKLLELNLALDQGNEARVLKELEQMIAFQKSTMQGHIQLMDLALQTSLLRRIQSFTVDAAKDIPSFAKILKKDQDKFVVDLDRESLKRAALHGDMEAVHAFLKTTSITREWEDWANWTAGYAMVQTPHRILNGQYSCWKTGRPPDHLVFYPATKFLVKAFCQSIASVSKRFEEKVEQLRQPLDI